MGDLFGSKPVVPTLPKLNLGTEQGTAIQNNTQNLPGAENLVGKANQFSIDQINQMLEQAVPGYSGMVKTLTGTINSELHGQIPTDVSQQVQNSAAARAMGGGYGGSGAHGDLVARDLGLTSLNLTQQGLSSMESWTKTAASLYEPSMMSGQACSFRRCSNIKPTTSKTCNSFKGSGCRTRLTLNLRCGLRH